MEFVGAKTSTNLFVVLLLSLFRLPPNLGRVYPDVKETVVPPAATTFRMLKIGLPLFSNLSHGVLLLVRSYSYALPASQAGLIPILLTGYLLTSSPLVLPHQSTI